MKRLTIKEKYDILEKEFEEVHAKMLKAMEPFEDVKYKIERAIKKLQKTCKHKNRGKDMFGYPICDDCQQQFNSDGSIRNGY